MSEEVEEKDITTAKEMLLTKHRTEGKQLQARIQQLKKCINKDKKRKKEITEQIMELERELQERHTRELLALTYCKETEEMCSSLTDCLVEDQQNMGENESENLLYQTSNEVKKMSKAEKRRQKKADLAREREILLKEAEEMNKFSARNIEAETLKNILKQKTMSMYEISPDGNCMYAAIAHQLGSGVTVSGLRLKAGVFIRDHAEEFAPFLTDPKTGQALTPAQFDDYCHKLESTPAWGGQPELRALSQVLEKRIEVLQAEGSSIVFGEEFGIDSGVMLAYYRHYYGLGEHYNSVVPLTSAERS